MDPTAADHSVADPEPTSVTSPTGTLPVTPSPLPSPSGPLAQPPLREVRLAIVMYGGVSLAIYMNGVTQELLHLVRSTAPASRGGDLAPASSLMSTEPVYRSLSQIIHQDEHLPAIDPTDAVALDGRPSLARFVIDVLSGSSAGGINGIFLAKALANDQDLKPLGDLWIKEGDIAVLLNDKESVKDLDRDKKIALEQPPPSLLNGKRMYLKLLEAFSQMDNPRASQESDESRLADEIDLFVTATDLAGLLLPIRLSNRLTWERRYRNVFRFKYAAEDATGSHRNDFHQWNNAFLAFAARCTSAFPWAFEPVELDDIRDTVFQFSPYSSLAGLASNTEDWADRWRSFFADYLTDPLTDVGPAPQSVPFPQRAFGDGGALDNKPFSYATATLLRRQAEVPVDRKLLFVEPDPGHPERSADPANRPDALQDFLEQGVLLPRQETIRDDLQTVFDRNRVIDRVDRILQDLDVDFVRRGDVPHVELRAAAGGGATDRDLSDDIDDRGLSYGGYHRVRVQALTDDLAELVGRVAGLPEEPEYVDAVRYLVAAWRDANYSEYRYDGPGERDGPQAPADVPPAPGTPGTTNRLLADFDLGYRLRRLALLQRRIDRLYSLDERAQLMLQMANVNYWPHDPDERAGFRQELVSIKRKLVEVHKLLRSAGRAARARPTVAGATATPGASDAATTPVQPTIPSMVHDTGVTMGVLGQVLAQPTEAARQEFALSYYMDHAPAFDALGRRLASDLAPALALAKAAVVDALGGPPPPDAAAAAARNYLVYTYNLFEDYDSVAFPMLYAADAGEADIVEVIRVGPLDAVRLVNPNQPGGPAKVTGSKYMHFGAFLSRLWRERDIMWGRLDAAEILIDSLLPQDTEQPEWREAQVESLRLAAQRTIVREQIGLEARRDLVEALAHAAAESPGDRPAPEKTLRDLIASAGGGTLDQRTLEVLQLVASDKDLLLDYVKRTAGDIEPLPPKETLRTLSRGAHIMGGVLRRVAKARKQPKMAVPFAWVGRAGALLSGMVEVATPRSFAHLVWRHWLALIAVLEVLAIVGGAFLSPPVAQFGTTALMLTVLAVVGVATVSRFIRGKRPWWAWAAVVVLVVLAGLVVLAVVELSHLGRTHGWIPIFGR